MDKPSDLQRLPVEVFDRVLELLHPNYELAGLSQTCRDMNERVTPLIYAHTIIDLSPHLNLVKQEDIEEDHEDIDVQRCFNLMAGLGNNRRQQCRYVRKLTVRNGYAKASTKGTRWGAVKGSYFDHSSLSLHSPWIWANRVLGIAIPQMPLLSELVWTAEMPPTNELFGLFLPGQLRSLVYRFSGDFSYHLKLEWPSGFSPGVRAMKKPSLSSLTITDITSWEATEDMSSILVNNMESLKVLKLRFLEEFTLEDKLFNIVYPIIDRQSQLRLHSLHLRNALSPGLPGWLEAFDFTSIRRFTLFEANTAGVARSKELWNIFRRTDQRFESLITNCENKDFLKFVKSTQGLEQLMLCNPIRPFDDFPKLKNHFDTLKCLFLPQDDLWELPFSTVREMGIISNCKQLEQLCITLDYKNQEQVFATLSKFQNLKHLFIDRHDDIKCAGDGCGPTLGSKVFIKAFCDFCNKTSAASAFLGRLELLSYYRTLWSIKPTGQIDAERESDQVEEIDESAKRANGSEPPKTTVAVPVQIGWTDLLDDEMILAVHTWVVNSAWDGMTTSRAGETPIPTPQQLN